MLASPGQNGLDALSKEVTGYSSGFKEWWGGGGVFRRAFGGLGMEARFYYRGVCSGGVPHRPDCELKTL